MGFRYFLGVDVAKAKPRQLDNSVERNQVPLTRQFAMARSAANSLKDSNLDYRSLTTHP